MPTSDDSQLRTITSLTAGVQCLPDKELATDLWSMSVNVRTAIVKTALNLCGLELTGAETIKPIEGSPKPKPRDRLAAMRILASCDRVSIEHRKNDLLECRRAAASNEEPEEPEMRELSPEVASECLLLLSEAHQKMPASAFPPAPPITFPWRRKPRRVRITRRCSQRWPLCKVVRDRVITSALLLCGLKVTPTGEVEPAEDAPTPRRRTILAALRVLVEFDRLSVEDRKVELKLKQFEAPEPKGPQIDPEVLAKIHALIEEDDRRFYDEERRRALETGEAPPG